VLRAEFNRLRQELDRRRQTAALSHPEAWNLREGPAFLLYCLVRRRRPQHVLELGVANGTSTFFLLKALAANGAGRLHSVDVDAASGALIEAAERATWDLQILRGSTHKNQFQSLVKNLPHIDLVFQDGDQDPGWLAFMLQVCGERLTPEAVVIFNDADWSFALLDHCRKHGLKPAFLMSDGKVAGIFPAFATANQAAGASSRT
jgi:predicted O-methyltransferase YrrM